MHVYSCVRVWVRVCVCVCMRACVRACVRACTHRTTGADSHNDRRLRQQHQLISLLPLSPTLLPVTFPLAFPLQPRQGHASHIDLRQQQRCNNCKDKPSKACTHQQPAPSIDLKL